jgi:8-oxo-(d)GTP phosphatase
MKLFVKEKSVNIIRMTDLDDTRNYDKVINGFTDKIVFNELKDDILVLNSTLEQIDSIVEYLSEKNPKKIDSVTFAVNDEKSAKHFLKKSFIIIKAGGGLVLKEGKFLMISKSKKWDLPKGKIEKGEKSLAGAKREVEEECNIKVETAEKICSTWHTYIRNKERIMKRTNWYVMHCIDDSAMKPQKDEDISDVRWMRAREAKVALYNSYASIRHVFREYYKMTEQALEE